MPEAVRAETPDVLGLLGSGAQGHPTARLGRVPAGTGTVEGLDLGGERSHQERGGAFGVRGVVLFAAVLAAFASFASLAVALREDPEEPAASSARASATATTVASWYGSELAGSTMANGETFDPNRFTVAHKTLPLNSRITVCKDDACVQAKVSDRGPNVADRELDLSEAAADAIGLKSEGVGQVEITETSEPITRLPDTGAPRGRSFPPITPFSFPTHFPGELLPLGIFGGGR